MPTDSDIQFGEIAVKNKLISKKQHDEALDALKKLESELKKRGQLGKKRPRLVDVLVQKKAISGSQAKSVENARIYRQVRLDDKLYGRIALKSKFCSEKSLKKALERQQKDYLKGKKPERVSKYLLDEEALTDEQHDAIMEVIAKLDAQEYFDRTKKKGGKKPAKVAASGSDDDADESEVDEDDLEELDEDDLELDLDDDDDDDDAPKGKKAKSLDDEKSARALDSAIDAKLSSLDDEIDEASGVKKKPAGKGPAKKAPKGISSDELDVEDSTDDGGIDIDLDDDEDSKPAKKGGAAAKKKPSSDDLDDLDDLDLDDDEDSKPAKKGGAAAKKKAPSDDLDDLDDIDDIDLDDDEDSKPAKKAAKKPAPAAKKKAAIEDDDLDDLDLDLDDDD